MEQRRKTKSREAETSLSLFYTEKGNNVGKLEAMQVSGQAPWPWGSCKGSRYCGKEPLLLSQDLGTGASAASLSSNNSVLPALGNGHAKF